MIDTIIAVLGWIAALYLAIGVATAVLLHECWRGMGFKAAVKGFFTIAFGWAIVMGIKWR